jgi:hypothetical protein
VTDVLQVVPVLQLATYSSASSRSWRSTVLIVIFAGGILGDRATLRKPSDLLGD